MIQCIAIIPDFNTHLAEQKAIWRNLKDLVMWMKKISLPWHQKGDRQMFSYKTIFHIDRYHILSSTENTPGPESRPETPLDDSISSVSEGDHSQISEKRCKRKSEIDYDEVLLNRLKQIDERRAQRDNARNKELDEEDHFASTVASSLRRLAPNQRSLCKLQIQQLLHNFEFPPDVPMHSGHMNSQPGNSFYNFL
jgi:hypothetical protein